MEEFDEKGIWGKTSDVEVAGNLSLKKDSGLTLDLIGTLEKEHSNQPIPIIVGVSSKGAQFTLIDNECIEWSQHSPGFKVSKYESRLCLKSNSEVFLSKKELNFRKIASWYPILSRWLVEKDIMVQNTDPDADFSISAKGADLREAKLPNGFKAFFERSILQKSIAGNTYNFSQQNLFWIEAPKKLPIKKLMEYAEYWELLLTIITCNVIEPSKVVVQANFRNKKRSSSFEVIFPLDLDVKDASYLVRQGSLLSRNFFIDNFETIVANWFAEKALLQDLLSNFLHSLTLKILISEKFLIYSKTIESLNKHLEGNSSDYFKVCLRKVYQSCKHAIPVGMRPNSIQKWVDNISAYRNIVAHNDQNNRFSHTAIHKMNMQMELVIRTFLLLKVGVTEEELLHEIPRTTRFYGLHG